MVHSLHGRCALHVLSTRVPQIPPSPPLSSAWHIGKPLTARGTTHSSWYGQQLTTHAHSHITNEQNKTYRNFSGIHEVALTFTVSRSNLEFENIGFCGGRKTGIEPTTNLTHIWHCYWESNPGHISGRRGLSPLCHP